METKKTTRADLEGKKKIFMQIGLAIALLLSFAAFEWKYSGDEPIVLTNASVFKGEIIDIPVTFPEKPEVKMPTLSQSFKIVKDEVDVTESVSFTAETNQTEAVEVAPVMPKAVEDDVVEETPFVIVEQMPSFPGGETEMLRFLANNTKYPTRDKELGISGIVYVTFVVEKDGRITNIQILKGVTESMNAEAVRVIRMMPLWEPGLQRGVPVRVQLNIPFNFKLK
ncbi:MAG: TonB family protein [Bacteroidales bacterium]|nr:TonB family protein [Bacteroidales bacterium]